MIPNTPVTTLSNKWSNRGVSLVSANEKHIPKVYTWATGNKQKVNKPSA